MFNERWIKEMIFDQTDKIKFNAEFNNQFD